MCSKVSCPRLNPFDSKRLGADVATVAAVAAVVKGCTLHAWITVELICKFRRERRSKIYTESKTTRKSLCTVMIGFATSIYR